MHKAKAGSTSETLTKLSLTKTLLNEIIKKLHNNIKNSIKVQYQTNNTFMNSENRKASVPYRLLLNLTDKKDLKRSDKYVALSNLSIYFTWKNIKM